MLPTASPEAPSTGTRLLVTDDPTTAADAGVAWISPALAAWLVESGHAVALVDEHTDQPRQWLYLPDPRSADLVDELYAERFNAPRVPFRSVRAAAQAAS